MAVDAWEPWVLLRTSPSGVEEYGGATYDFFMQAVASFKPQPILQIIPGWATEQSRQKFESSYTACVHDVAVGNFDICIADMWLTPERHQLASFLPAVRQDHFYLVVPKKMEVVTIWSLLQKPFQPFTADGWLGVAAVLIGMAVLHWLLELSEEGMEGNWRSQCSWSLALALRFQFTMWHDFFQGGSSLEIKKGAAYKFFSLAFSFFLLVTLASYTASLASMLVVRHQAVGTISSIEHAVSQQARVCIPSVLLQTFRNVYPHAIFVTIDGMEFGARSMHAGRCEALVLSEYYIDMMHADKIRQKDCHDVENGVPEEVARCEADFRGNKRDDCNLLRVGGLLWSVPLSFPVSDKIAHSMGWAVTTTLSAGLMEKLGCALGYSLVSLLSL